MKTNIFLLVTLTVIANTRIVASDMDFSNPFSETEKPHVTPLIMSNMLGLFAQAKEQVLSSKIGQFFKQETPLLTTPAPVIINTPVVITEPTKQTVADIVEETSKINQLKEAYLRPLAIVSSIIIFAMGTHQAYTMYMDEVEKSKNVTETEAEIVAEAVTEVNQ